MGNDVSINRLMAYGLLATGICATPAKSAPGDNAAPAVNFDGIWTTTMSCPAGSGALGFAYQFDANVKDGHLHGEHGTPNQRGYLSLDGSIASDGAAALTAKGIVGSGAYSNAQQGTPFFYHVSGEFQGSNGTGKRIEGRRCDFSFVRR